MSGYQPTYQHGGSGGGQKPGPQPGSGQQPPSFKTNVNRNKTKRWVNAKSYSYDGDDWGSGDDESDDEEPPPSVPPVPSTNNLPAQQAPAPAPAPAQQPAQQPAIVRPADIYKRMAQEQQSPAQEPSPPEDKPKAQQPPSTELPQLQDFSSSFGENFMAGSGASSSEQPKPSADSSAAESGLHHIPSSGFRSVVHQAFDKPDDPDMLARSNTESTTQISPIIRSGTNTQESRPPAPEAPPTIEEEPAERRDSAPSDFKPGFRRSLTPPSSDKGPAQRPVVSETPQVPPESEAAHVAATPRSDPKRDASPKPELTIDTKGDGASSARSSRPASTAMKDPAHDNPQTHKSKDSTPAPPAQSQEVAQDGGVPTGPGQPLRQPSESQASPQTTETMSPNSVNDRLREDIMHTLNSGGTQSPSTTTPDIPKSEGAGVPLQEPSSNIGPQSLPKGDERSPDIVASPAPLSSRPRPTVEEGAAQNLDPGKDSQPARPQLKKKFSWEMDSDDDDKDETNVPSSSQQQPQQQPPVQSPAAQPSKAPDADSTERAVSPAVSIPSEGRVSSDSEPIQPPEAEPTADNPPRYSTILPSQSETQGPGPATEPSEPGRSDATPVEPTQASPTTTPQHNVAHVREIMAMQTHDQKLAAFNEARQQFAAADTGLEAWMQYIGESHPEHADVIALNGQLPADANLYHKAMGRSKFPKFSSLGNLSFPSGSSSTHDGGGKPGGHARQGSTSGSSAAAHSQQVQARGKEFLHSAGVLGGKAGGAAKGLFAKGRSRLRNTGGSSDKVSSRSLPSDSPYSQTPTISEYPTVEQANPAIPQSHGTVYERPLPALPSDQRDGISTPTRGTADQPPDIPPKTSIQPYPNSSGSTGAPTRTFTSDSISRRSYAEANRRGSPVSTLGPAADIPWRTGDDDSDNDDPAWAMNDRRDSVSTLGLSDHSPNAEHEPSFQENLAEGGDTPSTPQGPASKTMTPAEHGHTHPGESSHNGTQSKEMAPRGNSPVPAPSIVRKHTNSSHAINNGHHGPRSEEYSLGNNRSAAEPVSPPDNISPPPVRANPSTAESGMEGRHDASPQRPPLVMDGSEYQRFLAQSLGATVTSVNAARPPVGDRREEEYPSPKSRVPTGDVASGSVWKTADDPSQSRVTSPPAGGNHVQPAEGPHHVSHHSMPAAQPYLPEELYPPKKPRHQPASERPKAVRRSEPVPAPDLGAQPEEPVQRRQSRSGLTGFVSKMQSKSATTSPVTGKEKSTRLRSFRADMRNTLSVNHQGGDRRTKQAHPQPPPKLPTTGTFPMDNSKKATASQNILRRGSQKERPTDDGKKKPLKKITTLLRKSSQRGSTEKDHQPPPPPPLSPPIAEYYAPQYASRKHANDAHQMDKDPQAFEQQPRPASRPTQHRYYQSASMQQGRLDYSTSDASSKRYSSPPVVQPDYEAFAPPRIQTPKRTSPSPYERRQPAPINTNVRPSTGLQDNSRPQMPPPHRTDRSNNTRSYTADLHLRSRSPLTTSPSPQQQKESPINEHDPASTLGAFNTSGHNTTRVGDQETPWNVSLPKNDYLEKPLPKIPSNATSPDSPTGYPLPPSNVISPINPAAADIPPPPPPNYNNDVPLHKPEAIRVVTVPANQATSTISAFPSEPNSNIPAAPSTMNHHTVNNKPSPPLQIHAPPVLSVDTSVTQHGTSVPTITTNFVDDRERPTQTSIPKPQPENDAISPPQPNSSSWQQPAPATQISKAQPEPTPPADPSGPDHSSPLPPATIVRSKSPMRRERSQGHRPQSSGPVELPAGDDSSDEIVMSSTAYPGQEWVPGYAGESD